jgi:hypothetical protein
MRATEFAIVALATWRLSHLLVYEDGPNDLVAKLRGSLGVVERERANGPPLHTAETTIGKLFTCPLCLSVWVAPVFSLAWLTLPAARPVIEALAVSGASSLLEIEVSRR